MKRHRSFSVREAELSHRICRYPTTGIKVGILVSTSGLMLGKHTIPFWLPVVVKKTAGSIVSLEKP